MDAVYVVSKTWRMCHKSSKSIKAYAKRLTMPVISARKWTVVGGSSGQKRERRTCTMQCHKRQDPEGSFKDSSQGQDAAAIRLQEASKGWLQDRSRLGAELLAWE